MNALPPCFIEDLLRRLPEDAHTFLELSGDISVIADEFNSNCFDLTVAYCSGRLFYSVKPFAADPNSVSPSRADLLTIEAVKDRAKYLKSFRLFVGISNFSEFMHLEQATRRVDSVTIDCDGFAELCKLYLLAPERWFHFSPQWMDFDTNEEKRQEFLDNLHQAIERSRRFLIGSQDMILYVGWDESPCSTTLQQLLVRNCRGGTLRNLQMAQQTPELMDALSEFIFSPAGECLTIENTSAIADLMRRWASLEGERIPTQKCIGISERLHGGLLEVFEFRQLNDIDTLGSEWFADKINHLNLYAHLTGQDVRRQLYYIANHPTNFDRRMVAHVTSPNFDTTEYEKLNPSDKLATFDSQHPQFWLLLI